MNNRVAGLGCLIIALLSVLFVGFDLCVIGFFLVIGGVLIFGDTKEEWEERRRRDVWSKKSW